jgi:hypothetical protein
MRKFTFVLTFVIFVVITGCLKSPDLGDGYRSDSDGKYTLQIVNFENTVMINSHILEYAFDSTFIIVSQRPWDGPSIPDIKDMTYSERNEAFEKSTFRQYWIINKKQKGEYSLDTLSKLARYSNVYGPFKREEYIQKREELGVSKELQLKEEYGNGN